MTEITSDKTMVNHEIKDILDRIFEKEEIPYKIVISKPASKSQEFQKINILKKDNYFQVEKYTKTQVFHENLKTAALLDSMLSYLSGSFLQMNAWTNCAELLLLVSKKGKVTFKEKKTGENEQKPREQTSHNRKKNYLLPEGDIIPPLVDMGIFTKEGKVVSSMQDKYRQINRFVEIVDDEVKKIDKKHFKIVDFGCGKSYLTFILYYYFTNIRKVSVEMVGLDLKEEVIRHCNEAAKKYGYDGLHFECGDVSIYKSDTPADMVITLHACDTATDYALFHAVNWNAGMIFSVPCCQHELNKQFKTEQYSLLSRYGIIKERTSALITDAIRANLLEYHGYRTQILEFVELDNTPKNLLIRAVRRDYGNEKEPVRMVSAKKVPGKERYMEEVKAMMEEFHLKPTLYSLFEEKERKA